MYRGQVAWLQSICVIVESAESCVQASRNDVPRSIPGLGSGQHQESIQSRSRCIVPESLGCHCRPKRVDRLCCLRSDAGHGSMLIAEVHIATRTLQAIFFVTLCCAT